jgi:sugar phosphate isomerase/epimerase
MSTDVPVIGAAMRAQDLPHYRDWLIADQRDLELQDPCYPDFLDGDWQQTTQSIREQLDGYSGRMGIHAPFFSIDIAAFDSKVRAAVRERLIQSLDFAGEIGATHMVIHSPIVLLGTPYIPRTPTAARTGGNDLQWFIQSLHATMGDVIAHAQKVGCTLVVENIFDRDPSLWVMLAASLNSDVVKLSLDAGHAYINHKLGAPPPDHWLLEAGSLLAHIHLQDTDGYDDRHWAIGDGTIRWHALFKALGRLEQRPRLILEMNQVTDIPRSMDWLRQQGLGR